MSTVEALPFDETTNNALIAFADKMGLSSISELMAQMCARTPEFERKLNTLGYKYTGPCSIEKVEE